ncbi:MAG: ABC transporter ATP-binding protein [Parasporobacterium sp.]|nr:ABC transporter ATP-binding protein [Parasporobacterium sp.]
MAYIEFHNISKIYRTGSNEVRALDGIDFSVEKGELCVIAGHSGAGKTTLLNILGGMDTASSGEAWLDGSDITSLSPKQLTGYRRNDVGFVFQFYNLVQNLTALENVELASEICRDSLDARTVLKEVGLEDRMDNFPGQLSGGEQQRVSIARAIAKNPKIILCDEPTGALDYQTGKAVLKLLQDICRNTGKTVIIITHNSALTQIADRVIRIRSGKILSMEHNPSPAPVETIEW